MKKLTNLLLCFSLVIGVCTISNGQINADSTTLSLPTTADSSSVVGTSTDSVSTLSSNSDSSLVSAKDPLDFAKRNGYWDPSILKRLRFQFKENGETLTTEQGYILYNYGDTLYMIQDAGWEFYFCVNKPQRWGYNIAGGKPLCMHDVSRQKAFIKRTEEVIMKTLDELESDLALVKMEEKFDNFTKYFKAKGSGDIQNGLIARHEDIVVIYNKKDGKHVFTSITEGSKVTVVSISESDLLSGSYTEEKLEKEYNMELLNQFMLYVETGLGILRAQDVPIDNK